MRQHLVVAITGASGTIYGLRLCKELLRAGVKVSLVISDAGFQVLEEENKLSLSGCEREVLAQLRDHFHISDDQLMYYGQDNFMSPLASGSSAPEGMIVAPCTMGTLSRIASGHSGNLLERCADVMLKEKRPLVLVPRETPLSEIHLENMLRLSRYGVHLVPAMPAFYHRPESVDDLVHFIVGKALDLVGVENSLVKPWGEATSG